MDSIRSEARKATMDHPSRTSILCAVLLLSCFTAGVAAQDPAPRPEMTPPRSGVGAVSLQDPHDDSSLKATAERLAARIESGADRATPPPASTPANEPEDSTAGNRSNAAPLSAPRPEEELSKTDQASASAERTPISERFGRGLSGMIGSRQEADTSWWQSPELRVLGFLAVLGVAAVVVRRMSGRGSFPGAVRPSGVISVMARYPFGRGASLVLLECGPRIILLHQHGGRGGEVTSIAEFSDPEEIARLRARVGGVERREETGFQDSLLKNLGRYDRKGRPEGFGQGGGLPLDDVMETVDLTRRRPRRGGRGD